MIRRTAKEEPNPSGFPSRGYPLRQSHSALRRKGESEGIVTGGDAHPCITPDRSLSGTAVRSLQIGGRAIRP